MVISFFGHAHFSGTKAWEERIISILGERIGEKRADIYLGGYGDFDEFAYLCCKKYQQRHPQVRLIFVTPYLTLFKQTDYFKYLKMRYNEIVYPEIEDKPKKFAITYRNRYMVDASDLIVFYVACEWGGAYETYKYAKRKKKEVVNLTEIL